MTHRRSHREGVIEKVRRCRRRRGKRTGTGKGLTRVKDRVTKGRNREKGKRGGSFITGSIVSVIKIESLNS